MKRHHTAKELLIKFLYKKAGLISKHSSCSFITDLDYAEILGYPEEECWDILSKMVHQIDRRGYIDFSICPWCVLCEDDTACMSCGYGNRHGVCCFDDSDYKKLLRDLHVPIVDVPHMLRNVRRYVIIFTKFLKGKN